MASLLTADDIARLRAGTHTDLHRVLGAHRSGPSVHFAVWAPNAHRVSVIGDFNGWQTGVDSLASRPDGSGIWEGEFDGVEEGARYKYHIESNYGGYRIDKGDPFASYWEEPPATSSRVWRLDYDWSDGEWMARRGRANALAAPW